MKSKQLLERILPSIFVMLLLAEPWLHSAMADEKGSNNEALNAISLFAQQICPTPPTDGTETTIEASGSLEAKLELLIKRMKGLGIEGAAKYGKSEYVGVLRKDLAQSLREASDCRRAVFEQLVERLLPIPAQYSQKKGPHLRKQDPRPTKATLEIVKAGLAGQEIMVHLLINNLSKEHPAYFTALRAFPVCPMQELANCKIAKGENSYWKQIGKLNYTQLPTIKMSGTYKESGEVLSTVYLEVGPQKQEGYYFSISQDTSQGFIVKLAYEYRMGSKKVRGESDEVVAIRYGGIIASQPPTPDIGLLLTKDIDEARLFIVDPKAYELKRGRML